MKLLGRIVLSFIGIHSFATSSLIHNDAAVIIATFVLLGFVFTEWDSGGSS